MANLRANRITSTEVFETTGSVQFDGDGDALSLGIINGTDYEMGSSDFTIECWFNSSSSTSLQSSFWNPILTLPWHGQSNSYSQIWIAFCGSAFGPLATGELHARFILSDSTDMYLGTKKTNLYNDNQWHHIAVVRNGSNFLFFIDGILESSANSSLSLNTDLRSLTGWIGGYDNHDTTSGTSIEAGSFNGHISNFRILKGTALYTENFTPPTRELEVIPNTVLLACQHKTDATHEKTGKTITVDGNAVANELTPGLLTNVVKSGGSSAITGSVEFDGTGDYLQITEENDFDLGADDFTIEYWYNEGNDDRTERRTLYLRDSGSGSFVVGHTNDNSGRIFFQPRDSAGNTLGGSALVTGDASNPTGKRNYWRHYAVCRDGATARCFLDGVLQNSLSYGTTAIRDDHNNLYIGHDPVTAGRNFRGFISNLRIIKGTALYTQNFIPPTRKLTKLPGTVLLCCQDSNDPTTEATGKTITGYGDLQKADGVELSVGTWTDSSSGTGSGSGTDSSVSITGVDLSNRGALYLSKTVEIGKQYVFSFRTTSSWSNAKFGVDSNDGTNDVIDSVSNDPDYIYITGAVASGLKYREVFTATTTTAVLYFQEAGNQTSTADQISLQLYEPPNRASNFTPSVGSDGSVEFAGPTTINTENYFYLPTGNTESRTGGAGGGDRGIFSGGHSPTNTIDFITISTTGNSQDFGDLTYTPFYGAACASSTRGLHAGGATPTIVNTINYLTIMTMGNAFDFGDLTRVSRDFNAFSSQTRGVFAGGSTPTEIDTIDFVTIATTSNAIDFGNLSSTRQQLSGSSSPTRGIIAGGLVSPAGVNTIEYITIASTGDAVDFGDLVTRTWALTAAASQTRSIIAGGAINPGGGTTVTNTANYITIASTGNANDFGDLTVGRFQLTGVSNSTRGAFAGGYIPSPTSANQDTIDFVTIASTGNASDFGNLHGGARREMGGCSNGHGGLG